MAEETPQIYRYPQAKALSTFLPILKSYLPLSNGLYNRIRAPHNVPSRHCLFGATFPPSMDVSSTDLPQSWTIFFADRSRHSESQIWIFNPLVTEPSLSPFQQTILAAHLTATILFLRDVQIPEAPGWPFEDVLKFACLHEYFSTTLKSIAEPRDAFVCATYWNLWSISTSAVSSTKHRRPLPEGFTCGRVPDEQLDIVLSTSSIVRQASTMLTLPNVGVFNENGRLVAWSYIGIDCSFVTLYVLEEYRGNGLGSYVAIELLGSLHRGAFAELGFDGSSGWAHSDVKVGNSESEGVMKSLGGKVAFTSSYTWINSERF